MTESFFQNIGNTGSRAHVLSHICCCLFERPHDTLSTHQLWVVVLYAMNLMVPLLKDTSVLPGVMLPLKVLIFGVPKHRPNVRVVISCPISNPDGAGHGTHGGGPEGTLPPVGLSGSTDGVCCLSGAHLPPPGKVTSWSSSLGSPLPNGCNHSFGGGHWGHMNFTLCNFPS